MQILQLLEIGFGGICGSGNDTGIINNCSNNATVTATGENIRWNKWNL